MPHYDHEIILNLESDATTNLKKLSQRRSEKKGLLEDYTFIINLQLHKDSIWFEKPSDHDLLGRVTHNSKVYIYYSKKLLADEIEAIAFFLQGSCPQIKYINESRVVKITLLSTSSEASDWDSLKKTDGYFLYASLKKFGIRSMVSDRLYPAGVDSKGVKKKQLETKINFLSLFGRDQFFYEYKENNLLGYVNGTLKQRLTGEALRTKDEEKHIFLLNLARSIQETVYELVFSNDRKYGMWDFEQTKAVTVLGNYSMIDGEYNSCSGLEKKYIEEMNASLMSEVTEEEAVKLTDVAPVELPPGLYKQLKSKIIESLKTAQLNASVNRHSMVIPVDFPTNARKLIDDLIKGVEAF